MTVHPPVVVVDDDVDHALIARLVLGQLAPDAAVIVMTDPLELPERLRQLPHQALLLMDRNLDGRDGTALLGPLRAERPDLHLVLLSAAMGDGDRLLALASGAHEAFEKPSNLAGWRALLGSILPAVEEVPVPILVAERAA
jgi:CheY-like chemotaxis protein